jgi:hypothetical protein
MYLVLVGKHIGEMQLARREIRIIMYIKVSGFVYTYWIGVIQDWDK